MKEYMEFTPEVMRYTGVIKKALMIDVPLVLEGISYRCTCLEYQKMGYCVMPFRRVTCSLASNMGRMINASGYFGREIYTVLVQIVDRENVIIEYCPPVNGKIVYNSDLFLAAVKAMNVIDYTKSRVWVDYHGDKMLIICKSI